MELLQEAEIFAQLLNAREKRQDDKLKMIADGFHLVSLQLNIPGLPKSNAQLFEFVKEVDKAFRIFLLSHHPNCKWQTKQILSDVAGDAVLYLFKQEQIDKNDLKAITEAFEGYFKLGRIVDLDVLASDGHPVSSGKAKACFICHYAAEECRKTKRHTIEEVRQAMLDAINKFIEQQKQADLVNKVASYAISGLLHEVALNPKPGLVCRNSAGAHTDMDFISFINSIAALSPYFIEINNFALSFDGADVAKALPQIRTIGLKMEAAMYEATGDVNTHKGAIFLMALVCFAVTRVVKKNGCLKINALSSIIQQITRGMVQKELCLVGNDAELTHGQQCFKKYGLQAAGARGEAEQGLPTVLHHALPLLQERIKKPFSSYTDVELNELLVPVLLKVMSLNNDTNILFRHDVKVLEAIKQKAGQAKVAWESGDKEPYYDLVQWCNTSKISPGGSADLLALTITLCHCKTEFAKK
ncbi:triphosphoribosyl-dephospho-CoA synthase [Carboxylicivirga sp. A043]|uniref:triphosphoribosyl-dephospho-CoA synthase n=1 Tax=Carboxylicivirga litoralis TaxID=2816963 RepID=UPI0021CB80E1|nr:triphosphoribosyl-dephospho-CoA synthase [Carboxylicivirga sp. A043]MCU4157371.1 triphosphoribosyl-dephospho-CoA synthase [Carboxylicivirga sp. A043]